MSLSKTFDLLLSNGLTQEDRKCPDDGDVDC